MVEVGRGREAPLMPEEAAEEALHPLYTLPFTVNLPFVAIDT